MIESKNNNETFINLTKTTNSGKYILRYDYLFIFKKKKTNICLFKWFSNEYLKFLRALESPIVGKNITKF